MWQVSGFNNESDVEQKFLYRLLTEPEPLGLGLPDTVILTKANLARLPIGKGQGKKLYFPDYLVTILGLPLLVIEAKSPLESVEEGYREARLYAQELNALYATVFNPTKFVVASNGIDIWYGYADQSSPLGQTTVANLGAYSPDIATLHSLVSWKKLNKYADSLAESTKPNGFFKPRRLVGGVDFQNEEVGKNTFGATLTASISSIFNPTSMEERAFIAHNGYIPSRRRERYVDPIDRVIRAAKPPSETEAIQIEDTSRPKEIIAKLKDKRELEHKILLLIGSVGSGKTTFVDYLREVALPRELIANTVWCRIDMNAAPVSPNEIYQWLRAALVEACKGSMPDEDFDDLDVLRRVYSVEINRFTKGIGKLLLDQPIIFNQKLAECIQEIQNNLHAVANAHIRFCCGDLNKICIIVLDNCDKKTRDEQLLMFEAAQWLQKEFRALVILPLRDETYDNHKSEPPLGVVNK